MAISAFKAILRIIWKLLPHLLPLPYTTGLPTFRFQFFEQLSYSRDLTPVQRLSCWVELIRLSSISTTHKRKINDPKWSSTSIHTAFLRRPKYGKGEGGNNPLATNLPVHLPSWVAGLAAFSKAGSCCYARKASREARRTVVGNVVSRRRVRLKPNVQPAGSSSGHRFLYPDRTRCGAYGGTKTKRECLVLW